MGGRGSGSGIGKYTTGDYQRVIRNRINNWLTTGTDNLTTEDKRIMEAFISEYSTKSGPVSYAYGLSRGMSMSDSELEALKPGSVLAEGKISSWSNKVGVAQTYARGHKSDSKPNQVVVRTKDPISRAAKISDVLPGKYGLGESLVSSKAKFRVDRVKKNGNYTEVWVKPIN